jgi:plastocyanin
MKTAKLFLVAALAFAGVACSSDPEPSASDPKPSEQGSTVTVAGLEFAPATLNVAVGTKVTWKWSGSVPHNVVANDGSFTSGEIANEETFEHTFATAGTFGYVCEIHKSTGMTGTIVVS